MDTYEPPYTISDKMLNYISSISEKIGKISTYTSLDSRPHLRRNNRIKSIHSSLKIEANSLSLDEVKDVIDGHPVFGKQSEIQEVKNAYTAYEAIHKIDPTSIEDLKTIHGIMTYNTLQESGKFRKGAEGIFSGDKCIFVAPPAEMVESLMYDLLNWVNNCKGKVHPLIVASVFHYEFVFIHPFTDGNGRMARLWTTVILYKWKNIFEYIPLESQIEKFQTEYYDAISKCHTNGNSNCFIEFMLGMIDNVLDDMILQVQKSNYGVSEYVKRLINCMESDIPYTAKQLMEILNMKSRDNFRKNYLDPALELNLIEMTVPDKPRSKNQRYIKR